MGTWCIIGDIQREFKGPNLEYSGWQRVSHTTPDAMDMDIRSDVTPEEARDMIISHVMEYFPDADMKTLGKIV